MSNYVGINLSKDLACIAVVGFLPDDSVEMKESVIFTYTDGRAFRTVPYFNRWRPEFVLHDNNIADLDFPRALSDICVKHGASVVGYDATQTKILSRYAIAVDKDSPRSIEALHLLNVQAQNFSGDLFPVHSAAQYMWQSLPSCNGEKVFPTGELVASGRFDLIRAVTTALAVGLMERNYEVPWMLEEKAQLDQSTKEYQLRAAERQAVLDDQAKQVEDYWASIPPEAYVMVSAQTIGMPIPITQRMSMTAALPMLKNQSARFVSMAAGWERYAWRGFRK